MIFNSPAFLFMFLPVSLILYRLIPGQRGKNALLGLLSLVFYAFGGLGQLPVLLLCAVWTYGFGLLLSRTGRRKLWLSVSVAGVLALLGVYKYAAFGLSLLGLESAAPRFILPMGISFFTFHAVSYLADVYRDASLGEKRFDELFLYLAFFPRLLAGPILRWRDAVGDLRRRETAWEDTAAGLRRFVLGMAKKLLLSESAAAVADAVFAFPAGQVGTAAAWLGAACYCLQIFFDFSGYSDMAIGLGKCFGFTFCENFDYPYAAASLREFWRRWHMSLNRWFTDYLYIPLGGSRRGTAMTIRNTMIVFFCTGLWHGAGWTFILWGLWHGLLVSAERLWAPGMERLGRNAAGRGLLRVYTLLSVLLGFVMFRAADVHQGFALLGRMFSFAGGSLAAAVELRRILTPTRIAFLLLGALFSAPVVPAVKKRFASFGGEAGRELAADVLALAGLCVCVLAMAGGGFAPFIYQQF